MFTKNWYKVIAANIYVGSVGYFKNISGTDMSIASESNNLRIGINSNYDYIPSIYYMQKTLTGKGGVIIGTGTTPPTLDDYCLSGDIISIFSYSSTVTRTYTDDGITFTTLYTITNIGDDAFTIGEIGLIANITSYTGNNNALYKGLLERTVLESPIAIPAGGVGQVTYTITFNYPTE